jgi:uncharacterized protein YycO
LRLNKPVVFIGIFTLIITIVVLFNRLAIDDNTIEFYGDIQSGDIIFQVSTSAQSRAIQMATNSPYSHMGMIYIENGQIFVFEAIQPVQLTPLKRWINRGKNGHYVIKRLKESHLLTTNRLAKMKKTGQAFLGKNYDLYFGWSDERMYCSELVWKIYKKALNIEIGALQKLRSFDLSHPLVQQKMKERYGADIPLDEWVISPGAMYESNLLYTVYQKP